MAPHLLVTNDFPPKQGGIQSYLWELWRRLPPGDVTVLTTAHPGASEFDAAQGFRIERVDQSVLWPTPRLGRHIDRLADEVGAGLVVLDPALPLGLIGRRLKRPYAVAVHGAEIAVPGRLPGSRHLLGRVLDGSVLCIAAGPYPAAEAARAAGGDLSVVVVPPGVDADAFVPLDAAARSQARADFGLGDSAVVVLSLSRLVPRKGMDVAIEAAARLGATRPALVLVVAGEGRDRSRLERRAARLGAPVRFLGRVADADRARLYGCADIFALPCRNRWAGLEQEGFGIVFLEAAACGLPALAGASGGAADAVLDGRTGLVVSEPADPVAVTRALASLIDDLTAARTLGAQARRHAVANFSYDDLAQKLQSALDGVDPLRSGRR